MRGGFLHNRVLAEAMRETFLALGATVRVERRAGHDRRHGSIDLLAELGPHRIACEIELSPRRVRRDLEKARTFGATHLLIVTPTRDVAEACCARLPSSCAVPRPTIVVLPIGQARAWVGRTFRSAPGDRS